MTSGLCVLNFTKVKHDAKDLCRFTQVLKACVSWPWSCNTPVWLTNSRHFIRQMKPSALHTVHLRTTSAWHEASERLWRAAVSWSGLVLRRRDTRKRLLPTDWAGSHYCSIQPRVLDSCTHSCTCVCWRLLGAGDAKDRRKEGSPSRAEEREMKVKSYS